MTQILVFKFVQIYVTHPIGILLGFKHFIFWYHFTNTMKWPWGYLDSSPYQSIIIDWKYLPYNMYEWTRLRLRNSYLPQIWLNIWFCKWPKYVGHILRDRREHNGENCSSRKGGYRPWRELIFRVQLSCLGAVSIDHCACFREDVKLTLKGDIDNVIRTAVLKGFWWDGSLLFTLYSPYINFCTDKVYH